ncbi:Colorectal mutant cancer protein [Trichuris trichiura]|uniref:Colorectal mutant cancer protein n=1 Tax=Trichuris trichiura TaxID=36087 RepID=A0A077YWG9_TRITR|nr:Colorectal mutant cancer protein [Trichuris trichiura]
MKDKTCAEKQAKEGQLSLSSSINHSAYVFCEEPKFAVRRRLTVQAGDSARGLDISLLGVTSQLLAEYLTEDFHSAAANLDNQSTKDEFSKLLAKYQRCQAKVDFLEQVGYKLKDSNEQLWCLCKQLESNQTLLLAALSIDDEALEVANLYRNDGETILNRKVEKEEEERAKKKRFKDLVDKRNSIRSSLTIVQCNEQLFGGSHFQQWSACTSVSEEQLRLENAILLEELYAMKENAIELKNEINYLKDIEAALRLSMQCQEEEIKSLRLLCSQLHDQAHKKTNATVEENFVTGSEHTLPSWKELSLLLNLKRNGLLEQNLLLIEQVKKLRNEKATARQHAKAKYRRRLFKLQEAIANLSRQFEDQLNIAKSGRFPEKIMFDQKPELRSDKYSEHAYTEIADEQ